MVLQLAAIVLALCLGLVLAGLIFRARPAGAERRELQERRLSATS